MGKLKIGRDVTDRGKAILSGKEAEAFEKWQEEQLAKEEEKEEKPKRQVELKSKMPTLEGEPSPDELARERAEFYGDMARLKSEGKLKVSKVVLKEEEEE